MTTAMPMMTTIHDHNDPAQHTSMVASMMSTIHDHNDPAQHTTMAADMMTTLVTSAGSDSSASAGISDHTNHGSTSSSNTVSADHMLMRPYLFSDHTGFFILFRQALVNSTGGFVGALMATFLFGLFATVGYEFGKRIERSAIAAQRDSSSRALPSIAIGGIAHGLRLLLHYTAMLIVMTMNIGIIVAVVLGHALGFVLVTLLGNKGPFADRNPELSAKETNKADGGCDC
jgi:Ctr copper transporter family